MHRYYVMIVKDYKYNTQAARALAPADNESPRFPRQLSLREGGLGGGFEKYKLLEETLKEFGSIEDDDNEPVATGMTRQSPRISHTESEPSITGSPTVKIGVSSPGIRKISSVEQSETTPATRRDNWTAITGLR